jgi:hypothetical protein
MALTQDERIALSKKIIDIPRENAQADLIKDQINEGLIKAQNQDSANKSLQDDKTSLINGYQLEITRYDGNTRTTVLEQDIIDSANKIKQNAFFPNDLSIPLPSVADGVWKNFIPFSRGKAIGKNYLEVYPSVIQKEQDLINIINGYISTMETYSGIGRSTGQKCTTTSGSCSLPIYTTQPTCVAGGGIWTAGSDVIAADPLIQATATSLVTAINDWKTFIQATDAVIITTDPNSTRQNQNNISKNNISSTVVVINNWSALPNFDTSHGQTTCVGFNSYDPNLLAATKFRSAELQLIKNQITNRANFIVTRISEINVNLGSINQDMSNGSLISASGLYGDRLRIIDLRLNLMSGSLNKVYAIQRGQGAQDELKSSNANALLVYSSVMVASAFKAPSIGSDKIHLESITGLNVGDSVYVVAEDQQEISADILAISGLMVTLNKVIPQKYTRSNRSRLYKIV